VTYEHVSVLVKETLEYLKVEKGKKYIDATAGGGGHSKGILSRGGMVLAIDRDPEAVKHLIELKIKNLTVKRQNFAHIYIAAKENGFVSVSGIVFDLGLSSNQLKDPQRGFSFQSNGPLDMRTDPSLQVTAADIINNFEKRRLHEIFQKYSQERFSRPIADAIDVSRQIKPITTTGDLAKIVREVYRVKKINTKLDPATKVFQALRIVVNSELLNLEDALKQTDRILKGGGRLVIISFHSLEDAIVKHFFKNSSRLKVLTKSPIGPSHLEIAINPRARSAKLRVAEMI